MEVIVYGRPTCQPCTATCRRFERAGVDVVFYDVAALRPEMVDVLASRVAGTGLPWVQLHDNRLDGFGEAWAGYRPDRIDAAAAR